MLTDDTQDLAILGMIPNCLHDGEAEFALGQIIRESLGFMILFEKSLNNKIGNISGLGTTKLTISKRS